MLLAMTSAAGSPGVTTTSLVMASVWPRPALLVEADPSGASSILAGYFRGQLPHDRGLMALVQAERAGTLDQALATVPVPLPGSTAAVIPGLSSPAQADAALALWPALLPALRSLGTHTDVLVDAGRLGHRHEPTPLLLAADTVVVLTRGTLPSLAVTRSRLRSLTGVLPDPTRQLRLLIVGTGAYPPQEIAATLEVPLLGVIDWDPAHAGTYSDGIPSRRLASSRLLSSARRVIAGLPDMNPHRPATAASGASTATWPMPPAVTTVPGATTTYQEQSR